MEGDGQAPRLGRIALGIAAAVLVAAIAYASFRDAKPGAAETAANAQEPAAIESLQAAARAAPDDSRAWAALGMAHFDRDEYPEAASALERATALAPGQAQLWSVLGEARARGSERDPLPPAALEAFRKALSIDPKDPPSRYFLAVRKDLDGDHDGAIADWLALLADTPPGAPWETDLKRTIEQVGAINRIEVAGRIAAVRRPDPPARAPMPAGAGGAMPGPTAEQIRDAAKLSPSEQNEMVQGMVARLEERLKADPRDVSRWVMLMRSRMTLREPARASAALKAAVAANPGAKAQLEAEARALGVPAS